MDLIARMEAAKAKPAAAEASPEVVEETQAATTEAAAQAQGGEPATNPPGEAAPPEAPAKAPSVNTEIVPTRIFLAGQVASGIVAARMFDHHAPNYADVTGYLAVEVADAIIKASTK